MERLRELMAQIGEIENFGIVVGHEDNAIWQIVISEDDAPIMIETDLQRHVVVFSSEIGTPKDQHIEKINALALEYSHLYASTGGARISRSKDDGIYSLIADFGIEGLTRANLGGELRRFATMVGGWREIMADDPATSPAAADSSFGFDGIFLRA
jgi:hypothetical protein